MKTGKLLAYIFLSILLLSISYFFVRPYFRLPFDEVPIYAAVEESTELLIKLPADYLSTPDTSHNYLWEQNTQQLLSLLDSMQLSEIINWDEWWLMPQNGENSKEVTFTFIGSSSQLGKHWRPKNYGPSLPYGEGQIYTYAIATEKPVYFARYHNLLIVGQYPFQIERALLAAQEGMKSWAQEEQVSNFFPLPDEKGWQCLLRNDSLKNSAVKSLLGFSSSNQSEWEWAYLHINPVDSIAYAKALLMGSSAVQPNFTSFAWSLLPPNTASAFPITRMDVPDTEFKDITVEKWLGENAWTLRLIQPATDIKVDPRIWVLPIGDSLAYNKFKNLRRSDLTVIDRAKYQLFDLEQWQNAGPFSVLSDRKLWQPWTCELQGALILSVYRDDIEQYLDYHLLGATLAETRPFLELRERLEPLENADWQAYQYWQSATDGSNILQLMFPDAAWSKHGVLLAQATIQANNTTLIEGIIQEAPKRGGTTIDWSVALPTAENLNLFKVIDENDQIVGSLVQNTNGQIWAFDLAGHELWQNQLPEVLFDPIRAVNYSSGIQRWVAATKADIYIWDNNGIDQANRSFKGILPTAAPIHLTFPAIDETLIAFPTKERELVLRYLNGNAPQGWPVEIIDDVADPLLYIGQEREDLIIAHTFDGTWQVTNSQGVMMDTFRTIDTTIIERVGELYLSPSKNLTEPDRLVKAQLDGTLSIHHLSGEEFKLRMGRGPIDNFIQTECWGDNRPDYVVQRGSLLHLFAYENNDFAERWQYRLPVATDRIIAAPPYGVLAMSDSRKKIWLIDAEGILQEGFPVAGQGNAFLTGSTEDGYRLITILDRKLYAYYILD